LTTGDTFAGVLFEVDAEAMVLRNAHAVGSPSQGNVPVDGEVVLLRQDVAYLQLP
jgi:hypothetical protein